MGAIFLGFIVLILAVFCMAAARRVVLNLAFSGSGIFLRLVFIWIAAAILYSLVSLVPPLLSFEGSCVSFPGGQEDCGLGDFVAYTLELSFVFSLLVFGLFFLAVLVGSATGLVARHRKLSPKPKRF